VGERDELVSNVRQLLELERGFGVDWLIRPEPSVAVRAAPPVAAPETGGAVVHAPPAASRPALTVAPPAASGISPTAELAAVAREANACTRCGLCRTRTKAVPGEGHLQPKLVFVGEGPGAEEDAQGRPFVGAAGQLLDKMIVAMGLTRAEVFIANVIKCRPPDNRTPEAEEIRACLPFLERQLTALAPTVICTLGNIPLRALLDDERLGITRVRGKRFAWRGVTLIPTFHPAYLLRNPDAKKPCWDDLKLVVKELGRELPVTRR